MLNTWGKIVGSTVIAGALLFSTNTPAIIETVTPTTAQAATKDSRVTTQISTTAVTAVYSSFTNIKKKKVARKLPKGTYIKKIDTVEYKKVKYYSIEYSNGHLMKSMNQFDNSYKTYRGYVKVSQTKKNKITIKGEKALENSFFGMKIDDDFSDASVMKALRTYLGNTKRYTLKENVISNMDTVRFDRFDPDMDSFFRKGASFVPTGHVYVNNKKYYEGTVMKDLSMGFVPASKLKNISPKVKKYTAEQQRQVYVTTKKTPVKYSFGKEYANAMYTLDTLKVGQKMRIYKEVKFDNNTYVFVNISYTKAQLEENIPYGWVLKSNLKKQ